METKLKSVSPCFAAAISSFDAANADDPNREIYDGVEYAREVLYSKRMTLWLEKLSPDATETLRLAARCQHIRRWAIPRSKYPMDRRGYRSWRTELAEYHAATAEIILKKVGYDQTTINRVKTLIRKENLKSDPEVQLLEDVVCLVFLENYFTEFTKQHDETKIIGIVRKTWKKMSPRGHEFALQLNLPAPTRAIVEKALF